MLANFILQAGMSNVSITKTKRTGQGKEILISKKRSVALLEDCNFPIKIILCLWSNISSKKA